MPSALATPARAAALSAVVLALTSSVALAVDGVAWAAPDGTDVSRRGASLDWAPVDAALDAAIADHTFPGCVAAVADTRSGTLYMRAHGKFTYGAPTPVTGTNPNVDVATLFDMASVTKVTTTTSAVATFYERGELDLDMPVADPYLLGPEYASNGKAPIVVRNLMLHNAGYPPDPDPDYWAPEFGCPQTSEPTVPLDFACTEQIFSSLLNQTLENPVGAKYVYSDLSMITAHFIVGTLSEKLGYTTEADLLPSCLVDGRAPTSRGLRKTCHFEAYIRKHVLGVLNMSSSGFLPPESEWARIMPTWNDTTYRHRVVQGVVSDGNSYSNGGICGHAGLFSCAPDMLKLLQALMTATTSGGVLVNATTVHTFTTAYNLTQSSRALGWDTNNYKMNTYRGCGNFSSVTYTHTGYTGTQVCNDPTRQLMTVLLTNRVYPNKTGEMHAIEIARQNFNNAVLKVVG